MLKNRVNPGKIFVLSGPSGAGKSTLTGRLLEEMPWLRNSISATTRAPRQGEKNGRDYFFLTEEGFKQRAKAGKFAEWCRVYGNYYGTPRKYLDDNLKKGNNVLLEIDVQGARKIKKIYPDSVHIFIKAPSITAYRKRLLARNKDSREVIEKRVRVAKKEMEMTRNYEYQIVNDRIEDAYEKLSRIILYERSLKGMKPHGKEGRKNQAV